MMKFEFDNRLVEQLPADPLTENRVRQVRGAVYSLVTPRVPGAPKLLAYSKSVASSLDLSGEDVGSSLFTVVMSGAKVMEGMVPHATAYAGHQFGNWAGQLGDGRAINLAEVNTKAGEHLILQLKGAGLTPYSRMADGLAVLRSSIREFLCSEAMHHLGIPTTRALSLCLTGDKVRRDMFYDGNAEWEPGAVVCRVAPSFMRFGHLQLAYAQDNQALLKQLLDFIIKEDFPHLGKPEPDTYIEWFKEVCERTRIMIVHWMRVGFVHGVMNTDNLSTSGLTIDYGPYGFLDDFDPNFTPNTTDAEGRRYAYARQPGIAHWNLAQLGQSILPLIESAEPLQAILDEFPSSYSTDWHKMMSDKLGLVDADDEDSGVIETLMDCMTSMETDYTLFFQGLSHLDTTSVLSEIPECIEQSFYPEKISDSQRSDWVNWLNRYAQRVDGSSVEKRVALMNHTNPSFLLRNYLTQQAIEQAEEEDYSGLHALMEALQTPYDVNLQESNFNRKRPEWARHKAGCSMLSCSS